MKNAKDNTDIKQCFCTNKVIPKEPLTENLAHLSIMCSMFLKNVETGQVEDKGGKKQVAG